MRTLSILLKEYLQMRRGLGSELKFEGRLLHNFVAFAAERGALLITIELALEWAIIPPDSKPGYRAFRLSALRCFARYANAVDARHEIPPPGMLPRCRHRPHPYIYADTEIVALIKAAGQLSGSIRPLTYATLLGLLSVTGMRSGEIVKLDRDDVDLRQGLIMIRNSKFGKSRLVPCDETTRQALSEYAGRRDELLPHPQSCAFFLSDQGRRVCSVTLRVTFINLSRSTGLRERSDSYGPRLCDMRHTFAVRTLLQWYRDDISVERWLPRLSTWLGHAKISSTYWYLTAVPELMEQVAQKLDRAQGRTPS